jgi:hypothetical protein
VAAKAAHLARGEPVPKVKVGTGADTRRAPNPSAAAWIFSALATSPSCSDAQHTLQESSRFRGFGWGVAHGGRYATPADFPLHDGTAYRGLRVRRGGLGFVHRPRTVFCRRRAKPLLESRFVVERTSSPVPEEAESRKRNCGGSAAAAVVAPAVRRGFQWGFNRPLKCNGGFSRVRTGSLKCIGVSVGFHSFGTQFNGVQSGGFRFSSEWVLTGGGGGERERRGRGGGDTDLRWVGARR